MTRDTKVVRLAVIPGGGIGLEVVAATGPVLRTALEADGRDLVKKADAVLLGAVGRPDVRDTDGVDLVIVRENTDTADLGGTATTADVTSAVLNTMESQG